MSLRIFDLFSAESCNYHSDQAPLDVHSTLIFLFDPLSKVTLENHSLVHNLIQSMQIYFLLGHLSFIFGRCYKQIYAFSGLNFLLPLLKSYLQRTLDKSHGFVFFIAFRFFYLRYFTLTLFKYFNFLSAKSWMSIH